MAEEDAFKRLEEVLDNLKDSSPKSKEYCKFIISLATATLVFSVTFLKEFGTFPEYNFILVIGWLCLLASIISGVLLLPKPDQLVSTMQNIRNLFKIPREILLASIRKELQQHYIKDWIKGIIDPILEGNPKKKEEIYQWMDKLPTKHLKAFYDKMTLLRVEGSEDIRFLREFVEELYRFLSLTKRVQKEMNPAFLFGKFRKIVLGTIWLDRVMKYTFFTGIFAISLFSIISILE